MKRFASVLFSLAIFQQLASQKIQTVVPAQPVVIGTAFQIQYIITEPGGLVNITSPQFDSVQVVSGPNHYKGTAMVDGKMQAIENITYTLVAKHLGALRIEGLTGIFKDKTLQSAHATIEVLPKAPASFRTRSSYTDLSLYAPANKTDLDTLIQQNLFIKTELSRTSCFIGEPIVASFTLYSCLQSTSEVVNSPSLYGFSVMDMLNINEAHQSIKTIGDRVFNVSVLRKLQLYPDQTGKLIVDEMQLQNEIEFDHGATDRNKTKVEKVLSSQPVAIHVKPLPGKKPTDFGGAVGQFTIAGRLDKNSMAANQQARLIITVKGKGNFIQFAPPLVQWPGGFDVFEPVVTEQLNKTAVPVEGQREYVFNFTTDSAGYYTLPPVVFSFFDPASGNYRTARTDSLQLSVRAPEKTRKENSKPGFAGSAYGWWMVLILVLFLAFVFIWLYRVKKDKPKPTLDTISRPDYIAQVQSLDTSKLSDKQACFEIQKIIRAVYKAYALSSLQRQKLQAIEMDCQLLVYSDIDTANKKEELKAGLLALLQEL